MPIGRKSIIVPAPQYLGSRPWKIEVQTPVLVIFGRNSSGKSRFLQLLATQDVQHYHYVSPERAGEFQFGYQFVQGQMDTTQRENRYRRNYAQEYRQDVVSRVAAYLMARGATRGESMPGDIDELEALFQLATRDFRLTIRPGNPPYEIKRVSNDQTVARIDELSSGESELIGIALDLLMTCAMWEANGDIHEANQAYTLLIDEPDTHLHPDLQQTLANFLTRLQKRFGVRLLIATHSTTLLAAVGQYGGPEVSVVYLNPSAETQDVISFDKYLKELTSCLGGHALIGPLFGVPIMLVEGDDDYRIWSEAPRRGIVRVSVIPCNGDEIDLYQRRLEKLFASLCDGTPQVRGYVLRDGDVSIPTSNGSPQQEFVRYIQLACHESENLYLTDEVLKDMGVTWGEVVVKVKAQAAQFGNKAKVLSTVDTWDRQQVDLKDMIGELSRILDGKNLHWTQRVGRVIGSGTPSGQLRTFLGEPLMSALWDMKMRASPNQPNHG